MGARLSRCHHQILKHSARLLAVYMATLLIDYGLSGGQSFTAMAHGVERADGAFLERIAGVHVLPFAYLGAKHMVTGIDHLLFLLGVIFFLYRLKDIALYVTLFALGHSATLLLGVLGDIHMNAFLIDAIIGLSVVYKAFENLGGFKTLFHRQPDTRWAVLIFGFFHGFGLATKLQDLHISSEGLVANILSFNIGVELGQFLALAMMLIVVNGLRASGYFFRFAYTANLLLMTAGFILIGYQLTGYQVFS